MNKDRIIKSLYNPEELATKDSENLCEIQKETYTEGHKGSQRNCYPYCELKLDFICYSFSKYSLNLIKKRYGKTYS